VTSHSEQKERFQQYYFFNRYKIVVYTGLRSDSIKNRACRNEARRIAAMRIIFMRIGCTLLTCDMYMSELRHIHDTVLSSIKMEGIRFVCVCVCACACALARVCGREDIVTELRIEEERWRFTSDVHNAGHLHIPQFLNGERNIAAELVKLVVVMGSVMLLKFRLIRLVCRLCRQSQQKAVLRAVAKFSDKKEMLLNVGGTGVGNRPVLLLITHSREHSFVVKWLPYRGHTGLA
jgi:hypothetical protein